MSDGYRTSEDLRRFFNMFVRSDDAREIELPDLVTGFLQPIFDALAWGRVQDRFMDSEGLLLNGPVFEIQGTTVPDGESRLMLGASGFHTDAGVNHKLALEYSIPGVVPATSPALASRTASDAEQVVCPRPVLLPAGANLNVASNTQIPGTAQLHIRSAWVSLRPGEYLPGAPFG